MATMLTKNIQQAANARILATMKTERPFSIYNISVTPHIPLLLFFVDIGSVLKYWNALILILVIIREDNRKRIEEKQKH